MNKYLYVFFMAAVVSFCMTPLAEKLAYKIGAIDVPKDDRRVHKKPIPRLGGMAIYLGFVVSAISFLELSRPVVGMILGATVIVLTGAIDDVKPLSPKVKLIGQLISAFIAVQSGLVIQYITIPFTDGKLVYLGMFGILFTIIWIVGITNTLNLIDGLDGLAAGVATIASFSLFYVAFVNGRPVTPYMTLAIAGACIGFLPYNFNPARIFMGDTGSMFLGFILSAISIHGLIKGATAIATVVPVLALGLPIFDTAFAILRRFLNGRPIMEADKGHLHHKLLSTGMGQKRTVLTLYGVSAIFGVSAALMSNNDSWDILLLIVAASLLMYVSIGRHTYQKQKNHK